MSDKMNESLMSRKEWRRFGAWCRKHWMELVIVGIVAYIAGWYFEEIYYTYLW